MSALGPYWVGDVPTDTIVVDIVRNGAAVSLAAYTGATIALNSPSGASIDVSSALVEIVGDNSVSFRFPGIDNLFSEPGMYTLQVLLQTGSGTDRGALIPLEVRAVNTGTAYGHWATPADVLQITGAVVDTDDIVRAETIIDAFTGARQATAHTTRNLRYLKTAVAYQAAWAQDQPDLFSRHDVTSMNQDQLSFSTRDAASLVLAPLAKMSLARCSWSGSRTKFVSPRAWPRVTDPLISDSSYDQKWRRL